MRVWTTSLFPPSTSRARDRDIRVLHARVSGRVRYAVPALLRNATRAAKVRAALLELPGVTEVQTSERTGTVLVCFALDLPRSALEDVLVQLTGARVVEPEASADEPAPPSRPASSKRAWRIRRKQPSAQAPVEKITIQPWHAMTGTEIAHVLDLPNALGLTAAQAQHQRERFGENALRPAPVRGGIEILLAQLTSTPVIMLGVSAVLSAATGGLADAAAIVAVVAINATIGYVTESGAERTIASLAHVPHAEVLVLRDGAELAIAVEAVVPGDVLVLRAGLFVPADARVLVTDELTVDESSLTGESIPVLKSADAMDDLEAVLAERVSMVYRGTLVTGGSGLALVIATGERTELGHVQSLTSSVVANETPMQRQLDHLGKQLAIGATLACAATLGVGLLRGQALLPMLRTSISLAVAAVPEGLPTVAMTTLALGLSRMRG